MQFVDPRATQVNSDLTLAVQLMERLIYQSLVLITPNLYTTSCCLQLHTLKS